jgi:hypothetical protein
MADLHSEINRLIEARLREVLAAGGDPDFPEWVSQLAESLAELVVFGASAEEQPKLIEHARQQLDHFIQLKQGMFEKQDGRIAVRS